MTLATVGKSVTKRDAGGQVTGAMTYAADLKLPGLLVGKVLRSRCAHARLLSINVSKARKQPGVCLILTAADIPIKRFGRYLKDQYLLAKDRVLYFGEPIAVIAASDDAAAEYAAELIEVDYEPLEPIDDPLLAMHPETPLLHPDIDQYAATWKALKKGNVCSQTILRRGDIEKGFRQSDHIFENTFETQPVYQCPLETSVALASKDAAGRLQVIMPTQLAFANQLNIAEALQIAPSKVCVTVSPSGGSFGEKIENIAGLYASLLAWHTDKPVRVMFSREEEFLAVTPRHPSRIEHKTGVKKDGSLVAWQSRVIFDTGAYAWSGPVVSAVATMFASGPYRIPHLDLVGSCVYTNKIPFGAFRGYGNPQAAFAHESQMDIVARSLGIDLIEIRMKNAVQDGDTFVLGYPYRCVTLKNTLATAVKESGWYGTPKRKGHGMGVACIQHVTGGLPSSIILKTNLDATVSLISGVPEIGTGVSTIASQIVSEELSLPIEMIRVIPINTDASPYEHGLGISRSCYNVGHAARLASIDLREQVLTCAAELLQVERKDLRLEAGRLHYGTEREAFSLSWNELMARVFYQKGGPLIGRGSYLYPPPPFQQEVCEGMPIPGFPQCTFATQVAELEADPETGQIRILNVTAVHDVGKTINPLIVRGQIVGGIVQGLGYALLEEMVFQDGAPVNTNLLDYKIPTAKDIPHIKTVILEEPDPEGPFGSKGIGEPPLIAIAPAVANALEDALGVRIKKLPLRPERVLQLTKQAHSG